MKLASQVLFIVLSLLAILHLLIVAKIVPPDFVWAGAIGASATRRYMLEALSLLLNLIFLVIVVAKLGYIRPGRWAKGIHVAVWVMFVYFVLNFFGNLASGMAAEKLIFAPLTLLLALLTWRLAIEK